jgi:hypothetical protein
MNSHQFLNNLPHFFVTHTAQEKSPLFISVAAKKKKDDGSRISAYIFGSRVLQLQGIFLLPGQWSHLVSYV